VDPSLSCALFFAKKTRLERDRMRLGPLDSFLSGHPAGLPHPSPSRQTRKLGQMVARHCGTAEKARNNVHGNSNSKSMTRARSCFTVNPTGIEALPKCTSLAVDG